MSKYSDILSQVKTKDDQAAFLEEIKSLQQSLYKGEEAFEKTLDNKVRKDISGPLKNIFSQAEDKKAVLEELFDLVKELETIELTLSFEPSSESVARIHDWISQNVSKNTLMDINVVENVIAGAIVIRKGKYGDFTVKKKLETYVKQKEEELLKLLK